MTPDLTGLRGRRVFVTGAAGFMGGHVSRLLVDAGAEVHALRHRGLPAASGGASWRASWHDGDLLDGRRLRDLLASIEPEFIFHLAAYGARPGEQDRGHMIAVNVDGSATLWNAMPDSVRRVVMAGTSREYADAHGPVAEDYPCNPRSPYVASKHSAVVVLSAFARGDRRSLVVLRPFGPYGPGDDSERVLPFAIRRLITGEPVLLSPGDQVCDFAFVEDHARAFMLAALANVPEPVAIYNIGSGGSMRLRSLLEAAADAVGAGARSRLQFGALSHRPDESPVLCADISAARRDLGYEATVPLHDGLERTVRWIRSLVHA